MPLLNLDPMTAAFCTDLLVTAQQRQLVAAERERQRFDHLVLGKPRPALEVGAKPKGMSKAEWKVAKEALRARGRELVPGIEERVCLNEAHGGRKGTPETIAHLDERQRRSGAIARLYVSRAIDADQLAAADKIATTFRAVTADAPLRTASWETRTDRGGGGAGNADLPLLRLGGVLGEWAIEWWLHSIRQPEAMVAIIARDVGLTIVAHRHGLSVPRARKLVGEALTVWWNRYGRGDVVSS